MLNVITATETVDRDGGEYTITTYAVGGYTLVRTETPDRERAHWNVSAPHDLPPILDMADYEAGAPTYGVKWSAQGMRGGVDARAYAAQLATAADVADMFNSIVAAN